MKGFLARFFSASDSCELQDLDGTDIVTRFEIYEVSGLWHWNLVSANGTIVATSSEGRRAKRDVVRAARRISRIAAVAAACVVER